MSTWSRSPTTAAATRTPSGCGRRDAEVALVSAGRDNDYGHPAPQTLDLLEQAGMTVWRTDRDGDVALVSTPQGVGVATG